MPQQRNMEGKQYQHPKLGVVTVLKQSNYKAGGPRNVLVRTISRMESIVPQRSLRKVPLEEKKEISAERIDQEMTAQKLSIKGLKIPRGKVYLLTFDWYKKRVGSLEMKGKKLHFEGDADRSAKMLFDKLIFFVEEYIKQKLYDGPRTHKLFISEKTLKAASFQFSPDSAELQGLSIKALSKWLRQAAKPGDRFIAEITK